MKPIIRQIELGPMQNYVYFVACPETREAFVVDPAWEVDTILKQAHEEDFNIKGIFVTHTHFDHVNGVWPLLKKLDVPVYLHKTEMEFLKEAGKNRKCLNGGDKINVGQLILEVLHTPGHTPGSQCLFINDHLISGDTLFINDCGRTDLPGGNIEEMYQSLSRLKTLNDKTILFPGHNYSESATAEMGHVKSSNSYMCCSSLSDFLKLMGRPI